MKENEIPIIELFSDGGAEPNPGKGGFGVILSYQGRRKEFSQGFRLTTNNRMELMGVIFGLEQLKKKSIVTVYTDSRYVIDGITKGWAEKWKSKNWYRKKGSLAINHDLWGRLLEIIAVQQEVKFHWVKGHAGHTENERCDELAGLALKANNLLEDVGYLPPDKTDTAANAKTFDAPTKKTKVEKEGDLCRKCGTQVVKKITKKRKIKPNQNYFFEYYFFCPNCRNIYLVEDAKRQVESKGDTLFE